MPRGAAGETAKKKPGQSSKTLPTSGAAPGELQGMHPGCGRAPMQGAVVCVLLCPGRWWPTPGFLPLQLAGLAASWGFCPAASTRGFRGGYGLLQRYTGLEALCWREKPRAGSCLVCSLLFIVPLGMRYSLRGHQG